MSAKYIPNRSFAANSPFIQIVHHFATIIAFRYSIYFLSLIMSFFFTFLITFLHEFMWPVLVLALVSFSLSPHSVTRQLLSDSIALYPSLLCVVNRLNVKLSPTWEFGNILIVCHLAWLGIGFFYGNFLQAMKVCEKSIETDNVVQAFWSIIKTFLYRAVSTAFF